MHLAFFMYAELAAAEQDWVLYNEPLNPSCKGEAGGGQESLDAPVLPSSELTASQTRSSPTPPLGTPIGSERLVSTHTPGQHHWRAL